MVLWKILELDSFMILNPKNKDFLLFTEYFKSIDMLDYYFHLRILDTDIPKALRDEISIDECLLKRKIIAECQNNPWFYLREIIPVTLDPSDLLYIKRVLKSPRRAVPPEERLNVNN